MWHSLALVASFLLSNCDQSNWNEKHALKSRLYKINSGVDRTSAMPPIDFKKDAQMATVW